MSDDAPATEGTPTKSRKGLFIGIAAAVVLLGGGAGAYFAFAGKGEDKHDAEKAKAEARLPAQFVELEPPFVVNFQPLSPVRFLQVTVQLMTRDVELVHMLEHNAPIIRNDLLLLFGNKQVAEVSSSEGREALRAAALETVRGIITAEGGKPEALEAVYFTSFVMQ
jgi:flagellar protein FliL